MLTSNFELHLYYYCSSAAYADVSQGQLPDSAYAFLRMIQAQKDWAAIGTTIFWCSAIGYAPL
jgi:hypothetical protein